MWLLIYNQFVVCNVGRQAGCYPRGGGDIHVKRSGALIGKFGEGTNLGVD